jgi:hypothetical protein
MTEAVGTDNAPAEEAAAEAAPEAEAAAESVARARVAWPGSSERSWRRPRS